MPRKEQQLSAVGLKHLAPGMHHDGLGLYLQVTATKNRSWVLRYMRDGKARYMGLGALHTIGLAKARAAAAEARQQLVAGADPIAQRQELRAAQRNEDAKKVTFKEATERYIAAHQAGWKNAKHGAQWTASLARYAFPTIGKLAAGDVDVGHVMKILEPIWSKKTETASRVRGRMESILDWAVARGYRKKGENPARWKGHLDKLLPARTKVRKVEHFAAMPYADVPAFMGELERREGISVLALRFTILCAVRTGDTIGARWSEIDEKAGLWIIPAERMKAQREHRVPLSKAALRILAQVPRIEGVDYIFPGARAGRPLSSMAMLELLRGMKSALTVHGFRSSFRDWAAERTPHPNEVVEMALAHAIKDKTEAAYRDDAAKAAMAMRLFGDAGAELIPFLNQGRDGIGRLTDEARKFGLIISDDTEQAARAYQSNMQRVHAINGGLVTQISAKLAPLMETLSNKWLALAKDGTAAAWAADFLDKNLRTLVAGGTIVIAVFKALGTAVSSVASAIGQVLTGEFSKAFDTIKAGAADVKGIYQATRAEVMSLYSGWDAVVKKAGAGLDKPSMPLTKSIKELGAAASDARARLQALIGSSAAIYDKQAAIEAAYAAKQISSAEQIRLNAQVMKQALGQVGAAARAAYAEIANAPTAALAEKMAAAKVELDAGRMSMEAYGAAVRRIQQENVNHWHDLASAVSSGLTQIFGKSKKAAIAAAVINTAQGITRNLAQYPQPFAAIMAAITAATGAAQIAAIRRTSQSGGGGGGGASAASQAAPTIPQQQTLTVQGFNPNDLFRGEQVREIAGKLLAFQKDGGVVVLQ